MRLIDADALRDKCVWVTEHCDGYDASYNAVPIRAIDGAPTINAMPVVRRCDCRCFDSVFFFCHKHSALRCSDFLCVYGEVKDDVR